MAIWVDLSKLSRKPGVGGNQLDQYLCEHRSQQGGHIMQNMSSTSQHDVKGEIKKYVWVDALRGYAILLVIMAHSGQAIFGIAPPLGIINNGIHGVSLFFLASSFTLFNSYKNRSALDGKNKNLFFFIRRLFRIAPLYWIACLTYVIAAHLYQSVWIPPAPLSFVKVMV